MTRNVKVRKAVIPAAGKGTRLLPLTRTVPKEMLPLGRKPVLHHIVDELLAAGLEQILFVISADKNCIPRYFDDGCGRFFSVVQDSQIGLADAVSKAEDFAAGEPVAVALGDSVISSGEPTHVTKRLLDAYQSLDAGCVIAVEEVPETDAPRYGIVKPKTDVSDLFEIEDLIEKPPVHELPSNLAIAGRYVLSPEMFELIRRVEPGAGGELQLTDAIRLAIAAGKRVWCARLTKNEKRIDIGTFASYFEALMAACCSDEELGNKMRSIASDTK